MMVSSSANKILKEPSGYVSGTTNQKRELALHSAINENSAASNGRQPTILKIANSTAIHMPAIAALNKRIDIVVSNPMTVFNP